jgi:hypothetical protein
VADGGDDSGLVAVDVDLEKVGRVSGWLGRRGPSRRTFALKAVAILSKTCSYLCDAGTSACGMLHADFTQRLTPTSKRG